MYTPWEALVFNTGLLNIQPQGAFQWVFYEMEETKKPRGFLLNYSF